MRVLGLISWKEYQGGFRSTDIFSFLGCFFVCFLSVFIAVRVNEKNQKMLVRQSPVRHA